MTHIRSTRRTFLAATALCVAATGILTGSLAFQERIETPSGAGAAPVGEAALDRFLANDQQPLREYTAVRRLSAVARGGKMRASLVARTSLDPTAGFRYKVLEEEGSGLLRGRVLHAALEAEVQANSRSQAGRGALTRQNYEFPSSLSTPEGIRVEIRPKRKDALLMEGTMLLTHDEADLLAIEGRLVKRPSFWTRKVDIVRRYGRVAGFRVPVSMDSTAEVLLAGRSTFSMQYEYESINGTTVTAATASARR